MKTEKIITSQEEGQLISFHLFADKQRAINKPCSSLSTVCGSPQHHAHTKTPKNPRDLDL